MAIFWISMDIHGTSMDITLLSLWCRFGVTLGSLWCHCGVTLESVWGNFCVTLGSLWGHSGVTWLEKTWPEVTLESVGSEKLASMSLRNQLARKNSPRSRFGDASRSHLKSLRSHLAREDSSRGHFEVSKLCKETVRETVPVPLNSEALCSAPPRTEEGYSQVHSSIYIYIYIMCIYDVYMCLSLPCLFSLC